MFIDCGDVAQPRPGVRSPSSPPFFWKTAGEDTRLAEGRRFDAVQNQGLASVSFEEDCIWTAVCSAGESKRFSALKMQEQLNSPVSHPI